MSSYVLTLNEKKDWSKLLQKLPNDQQDIYYTPEYYALYENYGNGKALCFVFEKDGDIALYPFLINSINDLGFRLDKEYYDIQGVYGYNGVITSNYNNSFRKDYFQAFENFCLQNNIIAEFVRFNPIIGNHTFADKHMTIILNRHTVLLNLNQPYEDIWLLQYSSNNRNMIRKGRKSLKIKISKDNDDLETFITMYHYTVNRIHADDFYHFSKEYFMNMINSLSEYLYIITAFDINTMKALGSLLLILYKKKAHYHLSARSHLCQNNSVNNFLLDEAIKFAQNNRCEVLHLGGGNSNDTEDPLFKFKQNFSKVFCPFYISKKIYFIEIYKQVCSSWAKKNPDKKERYNNILLKYHA